MRLTASSDERAIVVGQLRAAAGNCGLDARDLIRHRGLYFRVSVIGSCNLNCVFCHNEGGEKTGKLSFETAETAFSAAAAVGFERIQFTGGEPLTHVGLTTFVEIGRRHFSDVGVTTNGTLLMKRLPALADSGVNRIHLSLQRETLMDDTGAWRVPSWLISAIQKCEESAIFLRINLPVALPDISVAQSFLRDTCGMPFSLKVFALLADQDTAYQHYINQLREIVDVANSDRVNFSGHSVLLRDHMHPNGSRCASCTARPVCTESSRSLRLGVDGVLRPCLATRYWDFPLRADFAYDDLEAAALLAL
ncbi:MAG TPA: radical SAM protein, partial [Longimicrobium sp.]|nr:radical SAM protein [Longimicrobium sp.]